MNQNYKKIFRYIISQSFYPLGILTSMITTWALIHHGISASLAVLLVIFFTTAIIWIFEYLIPYQKSWYPSRKELFLDIAHTLVSARLITPVLKLGLIFVIDHLSKTSIGGWINNGLWPNHWSMGFQVILAILLADLLIYTSHRWMHTAKWGWRIHYLHHSTEKMGLWAAGKSHPLNVTIVYLTEVGALLLLGINFEALSIWTVFMTVNGLFQHCNIDLKPGILNHVLSTPELHRIHHGTKKIHYSSNFGNTTCIWDKIFGTFFLPKNHVDKITIVGVTSHQLPPNYLDHFLSPWKLPKFKK